MWRGGVRRRPRWHRDCIGCLGGDVGELEVAEVADEDIAAAVFGVIKGDGGVGFEAAFTGEGIVARAVEVLEAIAIDIADGNSVVAGHGDVTHAGDALGPEFHAPENLRLEVRIVADGGEGGVFHPPLRGAGGLEFFDLNAGEKSWCSFFPSGCPGGGVFGWGGLGAVGFDVESGGEISSADDLDFEFSESGEVCREVIGGG